MCEITAGATKSDCAEAGGHVSLAIYTMEERATLTIDPTNVITALTLNTGKQAWLFTPDVGKIAIGQTGTRDREQNSYFVAQTASMKFETAVAQDMNLGKGFLGIIAIGQDGINRHLGVINGMTLDTEEDLIGLLFSDGKSDTFNFVGTEKDKAPTLDDAILTVLLAPAA